ncbi:MAG: UPF0236 family transposase-like protein [Terriglobales bacterium]
MPTVKTTVSVTVPEGATVAKIEEEVGQAVRAAGKGLLTAAVAVVEAETLRARAVFRDKPRTTDLLTTFGWVRLERMYVRDRQTGHYGYLVETGSPQEHASVAVVEQAVALATRLPFRQAAHLLGRLIGEEVDFRTLYAWVKAQGQQLVDEEEALQEAVFEDGVVPPRDERERELVVAVVDGTYIKAQREGQPSFELRIGVAYSGRSLQSKTAKHRRYRLGERQLYGGVDSAHDFAERFYLRCETALALSRARHLLVIGDGADWIETLAGHERYKATYQLDHWHILDHARRTFSERPALVANIAHALSEGDADRILRLVALARLEAGDGGERIQQYESYLRANVHGIHGARRLRQQLSPDAQLAAVEGSGAVEKQADLLVARRFEHAGMRWTKVGANRLMKLRIQELERSA